jgi:hypothetical protein
LGTGDAAGGQEVEKGRIEASLVRKGEQIGAPRCDRTLRRLLRAELGGQCAIGRHLSRALLRAPSERRLLVLRLRLKDEDRDALQCIVLSERARDQQVDERRGLGFVRVDANQGVRVALVP